MSVYLPFVSADEWRARTAPLLVQVHNAAATLTERLSGPVTPLADPPAGSELKPVLGSFGPPLVGQTLAMASDHREFLRRRRERFGEVSWFGVFGEPMVAALGPDAIGEVLTNRSKAFANGPGWGTLLNPFFQRGVMLLDSEEHLHHRRIMQQAFMRDRLVDYMNGINTAVARGVGGWRPGDRFRLYNATKKLTLDIASEVFIGAQLGPETDRLSHSFEDMIKAALALVRTDVPGGAWRHGLRGRRLLEDYLRARIDDKRAGTGSDLFSVLCRSKTEEGEGFSDDDVVNHMIFLLMAAHDTSTITLSMMGYYLARHPEWQERLRAESRSLGKTEIEYGDFDQLTGLDMVMKETLRMNSPVGTLLRRAVKDTSLRGHHIPAGTQIAVCLFASHRMEPWWSDPDRFDPERFAPDRREDKSHPHAWTPFGGNVHKCIGMHFGGMEVKSIMHQMLLRYTWDVPEGYAPPISHGTGPLPADGLPIRLRRL